MILKHITIDWRIFIPNSYSPNIFFQQPQDPIFSLSVLHKAISLSPSLSSHNNLSPSCTIFLLAPHYCSDDRKRIQNVPPIFKGMFLNRRWSDKIIFVINVQTFFIFREICFSNFYFRKHGSILTARFVDWGSKSFWSNRESDTCASQVISIIHLSCKNSILIP